MSGDEVLRFEAQRTAHDYRSALFQLSWRRGAWNWVALPGVMIAAFVFILLRMVDIPTALLQSAAVGVLTILLSVASLTIRLIMAAAHTARRPGSLEPAKYEISPSGIFIEAAFGSSRTTWQAWGRAIESRDFFFLLSHGGLIAHILPKRQLSADLQLHLRVLLNAALGNASKVFVEHPA